MSGAAYKTTKAELVAIYRLEFYKKQKSWKLCHDARKEKPTKPTPVKAKQGSLLNKTYIVGDPAPEEASPFNEAFLDTDSDSTPVTKEASPPDLPQSWPNTTRKLHNTPESTSEFAQTLPTPANVLADHLQSELQCSQKSEYWSEVPQVWQEKETVKSEKTWLKNKIWSKDKQIWPQSSKNWPEPVLWQGNELVWPHGEYEELTQNRGSPESKNGWPVQSQMWMKAGQILPETVWTEDVGQELEVSPHEELNPVALVAAAEEWLQEPLNDLPLCHQDVSSDVSSGACRCESVCEFIRGAHCAPHSSELDLPSPNSEGDMPCAAALSGPALCACVRRHARALHALLHELRARSHRDTPPVRMSTSLENCPNPTYSSYEEFPTRDVGPQPLKLQSPRGPRAPLLRQNTYLTDVFLAGSYKNDARLNIGDNKMGSFERNDTGRGRGRLHKGLIGIGMGRPYRL